MEKNTNNKQIIVSAGIVLGFMIILVGGILVINGIKLKTRGANFVPPSQTTDNDMASMHAPPPPADDSQFQSLIGNPAPEFKLQSYNGREVSLADFKGKNVILFFSEGAMCYPSCWDQINAFTKDKGFSTGDAVVLTIVVDSKTDWADAVKKDPKLGSAMVLLDADRRVSAAYGVLTVDSSMHRGQFPGHTYVVIDKKGVVRFEKDDPKMGINNKELLADISKLD